MRPASFRTFFRPSEEIGCRIFHRGKFEVPFNHEFQQGQDDYAARSRNLKRLDQPGNFGLGHLELGIEGAADFHPLMVFTHNSPPRSACQLA